MEDPAQIQQTMLNLIQLETEFPIKVEGTHTLPYTARIAHLDTSQGMLHLKLIRPLPHEMAPGALFEMVFSVGEQRFEAPTVFSGREAYLLYRFALPTQMVPSDRRRHKRYPFRPREKAYVVVQDGSVPGHGLSGPLVNLSLGGLAFRVDRVMRLDDHLRVTPGPGFFERGKAFPMLKIRDLPKLPVFEARGILANAYERGGETIVGIQFGEMGEDELRELQTVLELRDLVQRSTPGLPGEAPREGSPRSPAEPKGPAARIPPAGSQTPDALRQLGRRSTRLLLVMAPGPEREQVCGALGAQGFLRQETLNSLDQALANLRFDQGATLPMVLLEPSPSGSTPLEDLQILQRELGERKELQVVLLSRGEAAPNTGDSALPTLPWPTAEDPTWPLLLDELAGLL
jgi:PilZ domain